MPEWLKRSLEGCFHLETMGLRGETKFKASLRISSEELHVVVLQAGSCWGHLRCVDDALRSAVVQERTEHDEAYLRVTRDIPLRPSSDGLFSVLGVLGVHWKSETGASLFQVLSG